MFLPNIIILYLFISVMEDTGYMARAAFIMDKFMHKIGLHGKSFIPLLMGFGCNVPAIMGTRIIESRNVRLITMLINPLMSCSARLPVYILLIAAFFPSQGGLILFMLYVTGIALACLAALFFKKFVITEDDLPFVMELPPYRMPTVKAISRHIWSKVSQYLKKMGGLILVASIFIWFLQYFPRNSQPTGELTALQTEQTTTELAKQQAEQQAENSYIGRIGRFIEPVMRPLGFDWKISASLLSGMAAKEVIISTLSILYSGEDEEDTVVLGQRLQAEKYADGTPIFTPLVALSLLLFVLIYFPCVATVTAIKNESGSWKWALLTIAYTTILAWIVSFAVYQMGTILTAALSHQSVG
ncbi:ferrous iron transport protein B [Candidatus Symbiothrix dinenymphae]|nr:ferrous iron transport protein B [Candidatus Symbiothrix dinenymphae]